MSPHGAPRALRPLKRSIMMIPYFEIPPLHIGPIAVQSFGVLAAAGVAVASWLLVREAARRRLDTQPMHDFVPWAIAGGVIGGHLMHLFLYHPEELHGPLGALQILKVWTDFRRRAVSSAGRSPRFCGSARGVCAFFNTATSSHWVPRQDGRSRGSDASRSTTIPAF
ncbi:MAG: prolipoprotein diacylglyceryl transferase [Deltaproteobacteria bacterium]|nr:MAG: prolipoprotein diacylglyceryl transferase [Deltaproteobacteria bacterium]